MNAPTLDETTMRAVYGCPDWCSRTDHHADGLTPLSDIYHYGPEFGRHITIMGLGGPLATLEDDNRDDLTAQELRQLAADALAAAEWLEEASR